MRLEDGVDYFFGVADQMDINAGFDGSVLGKRAEMTPGVWERHIGLMKRQRVRDDFQHQETDSSGEAVGELRGGFQRLQRSGDRRVEHNHLNGGLPGDDRSG